MSARGSFGLAVVSGLLMFDRHTATAYATQAERTLLLIKPGVCGADQLEHIGSVFVQAGLNTIASRRMHLDRRQAQSLSPIERRRREPLKHEINALYLSSGELEARCLTGHNAIYTARAVKVLLRGILQVNQVLSALHTPDDKDDAEAELAWFFGERALELAADDQLSDVDTVGRYGLTPAEIRRTIASAFAEMVAPQSLRISGSFNSSVTVLDDPTHTIDDLFHVFRRFVPDADCVRLIELAYSVKAFGTATFEGLSHNQAGLLLHGLVDQSSLQAYVG